MIILYVLLSIIGIVGVVFGVYANKQVKAESDDKKRDELKKQYKNIAAFIGVFAIVVAAIIIFTMF